MTGKSNKTHAIIFSCNRAMQLHLLLTSIKQNFSGLDKILVTYNYTDDKFLKGYQKLMKEGLVDEWVSQQDYINTDGYKDYIVGLLGSKYPYTCLFCDDSVIFGKASMDEIISCMTEDVLTFSLRVGLNIRYGYTQKKLVLTPLKKYQDLGKFIKWTWRGYIPGEISCFKYPLTEDGHIYRTQDIKGLIKQIQAKTVNEIEFRLQSVLKPITRNNMVSYKHSVLVSNPVNKVQTDFDNRFGQKFPFSVERLNEAYLQGKVIDLGKMDFRDIKIDHQELALSLKDL